jgi:hypothetical protein
MEAICPSETSFDFQWTKRFYIPGDIILIYLFFFWGGDRNTHNKIPNLKKNEINAPHISLRLVQEIRQPACDEVCPVTDKSP